jgi:hypothetical protein
MRRGIGSRRKVNKQAQEIKNLKAQLALSQEENQRLEAGIFGERNIVFQFIDGMY